MDSKKWQRFKVENKRGQKLAAMLKYSLTLENTVQRKNNHNNDQILIIVCHGFTGSKEGRGQAVAMGDQLSALNYNTLLFDFAGNGESEGEECERTLTGQVEDLAAMVQWARREGFEQIILSGRSFGGSTVFSYAAQDSKITAICTWAAVARLEKLFLPLIGGNSTGSADELIEIKNEEGRLVLKRRFFQDLANHDLLKCAAAIAPRSLLIIHGTADKSVPPTDAKLLHAAAATPKQLVLIEGADHRFSQHTKEVWKTFFDWLP